MKQKDLTFLIVSIFIGITLSIIVAKLVINTSSNIQQQVVVVPSITTNFQQPNTKYFNSNAIDPTQIINIAPSNNQNLFNQATN
jgi:peroxiredoxin